MNRMIMMMMNKDLKMINKLKMVKRRKKKRKKMKITKKNKKKKHKKEEIDIKLSGRNSEKILNWELLKILLIEKN